MKTVRTRYAPSPTGYLHIGGARSALFTYLTAKSMGGEFIIRTEDTDTARNVEGGEQSQLNNLAWLGIHPDESALNPGEYGPYRQSEKLSKYRDLANKLIKEGKAYYCFCSQEQLAEDREIAEKNGETPRYVRRCRDLSEEDIKNKFKEGIEPIVRLKINDEDTYEWNDLIRGNVKVPGSSMTDPAILKSNGIAMYNFANVIDDYDMKITHITRGEEHISNTPYQLAILNALGYDWTFEYAHMSIIVNEHGKKLSKRDTSTKQFIEDYKNDGYNSEAICNFIGLLGWSPEDNNEVKTLKEFENQFKITRCSKSPSTFDDGKMKFLSSKYIKSLPDDEYLEFVRPLVISEFKTDEDWFNNLALAFKNQIVYAKEINGLARELLSDVKLSSEQKSFIEQDDSQRVIKELIQQLEALDEWTPEYIKNAINSTKAETGVKGKSLFMSIRLSATKHEHGPELPKCIYLFGKQRVLNNLKKVI